MHTFRYIYNNIVIRKNFYMFLALVANPQGVHSCVKQTSDLVALSNMWNYCSFIYALLIKSNMCTEIII
jgi:hypothetical protein